MQPTIIQNSLTHFRIALKVEEKKIIFRIFKLGDVFMAVRLLDVKKYRLMPYMIN